MELAKKYVYKIYESGSFSKAAKELFISQPALSASVSRLEAELGFKIFDRSIIPLGLTPKGKIYVNYLEELADSENRMRMNIRSLSDAERGYLSIGASSFSARMLVSMTCGEFYKRYPKINVNIDLGSFSTIGNLTEKIQKHTLDLILDYKYEPKNHIAIPLVEERIFVAMSKKLDGAESLMDRGFTRKDVLSGKYLATTKESYDSSLFSDIKFVNYSKLSNTLPILNKYIPKRKESEYALFNIHEVSMHYELVKEGIAASLVSDLHLWSPIFNNDEIFYLSLPKEAARTLYFVYSRNSELSEIAKRFIDTAKDKLAQVRVCESSLSITKKTTL